MRKTLMLALGAAVLSSLSPTFVEARSYTAGRFALELDGVNVGILQKVEGGDIEGAVFDDPIPPGGFYARKHISGVKYEDFTIRVGTGMGAPIYEWIQSTVEGKGARKSGAIHAADFNMREIEVVEFTNALITEITIPALDGASKDPAYLTIKFSAENVQSKKGSGKLGGPGSVPQKPWLPSNFRIKIDGVDTTRVSKVEAITIKQKIAGQSGGGGAGSGKIEPPVIEFPDITLRTSNGDAGPFESWFQSTVVKGGGDDSQRKSGSIIILDNDSVLLELTLSNIGIFKGTPDPLENNKDARIAFQAGLFLDQISLKFDKAILAKARTGKASSRMPASTKPKSAE